MAGVGVGVGVGKTTMGTLLNPLKYIFRDDFVTDDAAPLASPRISEPGPGVLTVTDASNRLSIASGKLTASNVAAAFSIISNDIPRANGTCLFFSIFPTSDDTANPTRIGFTDNTGDVRKQSINIHSISGMSSFYASGSLFVSRFVPNYNKYFIVLRSKGAFFGGIKGDNVDLFWIDTIQTATLPKIKIETTNTNPSNPIISDLVVLENIETLNSDFGIATNRVVTPSNNEVTTMASNGIAEFTWTAANETINFMFRRVDDDNTWIVRCIQSTNRIYLYQKESGVETERGATGGVANTFTVGTKYKIVVNCNGSSIIVSALNAVTGAAGGTLISYSTATYNNTATGVKINGFTACEELITWPISLTLPSKYKISNVRIFYAYGDSRSVLADWPTPMRTSLNASTDLLWQQFALSMPSQGVVYGKNNIDGQISAIQYFPDYVLYNMGVNDVVNVNAGTLTEASFKEAVLYTWDAMHSKWPKCKIYVARVWMRQYSCILTNQYLNDCIALRSFAFAGPDESIWSEGGDNGVTMTSDGLHYSVAGKTQAAIEWQSAIGF